MSALKLVLLGPPGAGKGSQAAYIKENYGVAHISTGDMLRAQIRENTPLGQQAKAYIDRGELVPDEVIIDMVKERITQSDCERGFILDGFPRTESQAKALDEITSLSAVINIDTDEGLLLKRITGRRSCPECGAVYHISSYSRDDCNKCGNALVHRDDDSEDTVKSRLAVYHKKSRPLIEYYQAKGIFNEVDGGLSVEETFKSIQPLLDCPEC